jgi:signal transduction histidine kinase
MRVDSDELFRDGGEAGVLMRGIDWSQTPLGPVAGWSHALRTMVGLLLRNRSPLLLWWGPRFVQLYNDAYTPVLGAKHPRAMGQPTSECWSEIWHVIGPMIEAPFRGEPATTSDDLFLLLQRKDFVEETHFRVAYSPVPDDTVAGTGVGGVLATVAETTDQVYAERQLRTLRELGARATEAGTAEEACIIAARALAENGWDVPFALFYLLEEPGQPPRLAARSGWGDGAAVAPPDGDAAGQGGDPWDLAAALASGRPEVREGLAARVGEVPRGRWDVPTDRAIVLPLASPEQAQAHGVLVCGVSPHRALDEHYRTFFELVAAQSVTAIRNARAHEAERERAEALAAIDRAKTAFFSNVSHEFRTPLTLMLGPLEEALRWPGAALGGEDLRSVHRNTLRLLKLVNTLLDFSRIEAGRAQAIYAPVDLAALTRDLASAFRSALERGGLRFEVDCPPLPEPVYVDRDMWEKIVLNLLSNAFKFTLEGRIGVALRVEGGAVRLEISDTGTGVPAAELPRLFERFHRVEGARARTHEGSGIGLALVHDLVALHGGRIDVASQEGAGGGTTFHVTIPLGTAHLPPERVSAARAYARTAVGAEPFVAEALRWGGAPAGAALPELAAPERPAGAPRARVLVVDDNADMRDYVSRLLATRFVVELAVDGVDALARARAAPPDLVLTDVMMPNLDGFGLLRALRADRATANVPVIVLSARAGEEAYIDGLQRGADDYVVKPFSARELVVRVESQLALNRARRAAEAANRTKDQFLAMLGHELRNPLSPILTALQLMRLRGQQSRETEIIERQVGHVVRLVDDLLDVSRITGRKIELRRERVELAAVVLRGLEMASPLLEQRRQELELEVPTSGLLVDGDADRLAQVVSNLLTNAAKYSEPGTKIRVRAEREGARLRLRVRDEGVGIGADMLGAVFDLFVQQPQSLDRAQGGLGLGLSIVRGLVELHGGRVTASSEGPGRGSEFVVELPAAPEAAAAAPTAEDRQALWPRARGGSRILIVDDNIEGAEGLGDLLSELGFETRIAHDGPAALAIAATFEPDVCLLDIGLPVMDGYEVARRLREARSGTADLRIIALTGYGQDADRQRSLDAGFNAHVVKPVDIDVLSRIVLTN